MMFLDVIEGFLFLFLSLRIYLKLCRSKDFMIMVGIIILPRSLDCKFWL